MSKVLQLEKQLQDKLNSFIVKNIININHKPHPYVIGYAHVVYASDNFGGRLTEECILMGEKRGVLRCYQKDCRIPYSQHTSDKVLFLSLKRNMTNEEAAKELSEIKSLLEENKIDGILFVETEKKFRIT